MSKVKKIEQEDKNLLCKTAIHQSFKSLLVLQGIVCNDNFTQKQDIPFVGDYTILVLITQILHHFHTNL